jgi:hypothetical protein
MDPLNEKVLPRVFHERKRMARPASPGRIRPSGAIQRSRDEAWIQPKREFFANRRKQLKINKSKKAFICFY